jgi:sugar phosphate isomerase/epimerase
LRLAGYDGALSIEHEDSILSINEGFTRAAKFLTDSVITEQPGEAWWV